MRKPPSALEIVLQKAVAKLLRAYLRDDWKFTHIPSGEKRSLRTAVRLKAMGVERGWPDFVLANQVGRMHCLELKRIGKELTDDQEAFQLWCIKHGVPHVVAWTMADVMTAFDAWGCLKVRSPTKEATE